jgi:hypothetical protein
MIQVKHLFQAYHGMWMLLAVFVIVYGVQLGDGDPLHPTLRKLGPGATIVLGFHAFFGANRRRRGDGIGPIQTLLEGRTNALPPTRETTNA